MQLKLKRSLKETGMLTKTTIFCLDAQVELQPEEAANINKYKLGGQVIYSSAAAQDRIASAQANLGQGAMGNLKAIGYGFMARLATNVTINSLSNGQHIECKDLPELLEAEAAIYKACENLKDFLAAAATFDGRVTVIDFSKAIAAA